MGGPHDPMILVGPRTGAMWRNGAWGARGRNGAPVDNGAAYPTISRVSTCFNMFQHVSTCFNMFQHVSTIQGVARFRNHPQCIKCITTVL